MVGGIYLVIFLDEPNLGVINKNDFGCGDQSMITVENGKPKKHIYLVENLVKATPHLSCRMWDTYERVSRIALDKFISEQNPTYQPVIHYYNEQVEYLDPMRPAKIVEEISNTNALAIVGFAWSTMAGLASSQASNAEIPYISPTGVIKSIFENPYSVSLGTPVWEATRGLRFLLEKLENPKLLIVEATNQIQEREYADRIRNIYSKNISIQYQEIFPTKRLKKMLGELSGENFIVFIPGYTTVKKGITDILKDYPKTRFIVGPQWSHDHRLLDFDTELYAVSDYYNFIENQIHEDITRRWISDGGEILGGYLYALYDALSYTLQALNDVEVASRESLIHKVKNFGDFRGSKGNLSVLEGLVSKPIYILKYRKNEGFRLIEKK